jgi:hypothetical protein
MRKIILIFILFISISNFLFCGERKMIINLTTYNTKDDNIVLLTAEQPIKKFSLKREARLVDGKYSAYNFYLTLNDERTVKYHVPKWVYKEEYDKNQTIILDDKGHTVKDVFIKILPVGTECELVKVEVDVWRLGHCHYWIKLINDPEYKDVLIDAVALTNTDDNFAFNPSWWDFIEYKKVDGRLEENKIIVEKVPMFKRKWAKEIKEKK